MSRATLPAEARLHRPSEFAAALKGRRLARGAFFIVSAAPSASAPAIENGAEPGAPASCARLGMVIAKRFAPRAVTRNALKRVVREAFRARRLALPAGDYVVRLQGKVEPVSLAALKRAARAEVDAHFQRIAR
jgi:ribonuclease P protein component